MAKIVLAFYDFWGCKRSGQFVYPPFYSGLINEFLNNGNDVYCYIRPIVTKKYNYSETIPENILNELLSIDPDLFIIVNNQFWDVSVYFDCPIVCYSVDSPMMYGNLSLLKSKKDRFKFVVQQTDEVKVLQELINPSSKNIEVIFPTSPISNTKTNKEINVSFLGSQWIWEGLPDLYEYMKKSPTREDSIISKKIHQMILDGLDYSQALAELQRKYHYTNKPKLNIHNYYLYLGRMSGIRRARYLTAVSDLGLEIYGSFWATSCMSYFPELAMSYIYKPIVTKDEVEHLYNISKVCLQVNHIQAKSGFSWKIADIMSSGGCLLTNYSKDFYQLVGNKIPTFTSTYEARELCKKMLNSTAMREDIVNFSNEKANELFKPIIAVKQLEHLSEVKLINQTTKKGAFYCKTYELHNNSNNNNHNSNKKYKGINKIKYKIWHHLNKQFINK